jgi:hypothetical protein
MVRMERWLFNILNFAKKRPQEARLEAAHPRIPVRCGSFSPAATVSSLYRQPFR